MVGLLGGPVDLAALALRPFGYSVEKPVGGSEWIGQQMQDAGLVSAQRNPLAEALAGLALPGAAMNSFNRLKGLSSATDGAINVAANGFGFSSRNVKISDPKPTAKRPFSDDYPQAGSQPDGGRIAVDIEGRPLIARYVAGRNHVGAGDSAIDPARFDHIGELLGINTSRSARGGSSLKGDAGRYVVGRDSAGNAQRNIFLDEGLTQNQLPRVQSHELGHAIDDLVFGLTGKGGSKIPTAGLSKELGRVYSDLNSTFWVPKGKIGATPKSDGYAAGQTDAELMAEAIRAYMADPNYIKSIAPKTAARIREHVNSNPNLNQVIQFNSAAGIGLAGLGGQDVWPWGRSQ